MSYEASGKLIEKYPEQQLTEKFRKREFVVEIPDGMYPQQIKFELTNDRCSALDNFDVGDDMRVHFQLSGRGYEKDGKKVYFTNIRAWRLEKTSSNSTPSSSRQESGYYPEQPNYGNALSQHNANDDIPF